MADRAYLLARRDVVELHASTFILDEVGRVLGEKFGWEEERVGRAVAQVRRVAAEVHDPEEEIRVSRTTPLTTGSWSVPSRPARTSSSPATRSACFPSATSAAYPSSGLGTFSRSPPPTEYRIVER